MRFKISRRTIVDVPAIPEDSNDLLRDYDPFYDVVHYRVMARILGVWVTLKTYSNLWDAEKLLSLLSCSTIKEYTRSGFKITDFVIKSYKNIGILGLKEQDLYIKLLNTVSLNGILLLFLKKKLNSEKFVAVNFDGMYAPLYLETVIQCLRDKMVLLCKSNFTGIYLNNKIVCLVVNVKSSDEELATRVLDEELGEAASIKVTQLSECTIYNVEIPISSIKGQYFYNKSNV